MCRDGGIKGGLSTVRSLHASILNYLHPKMLFFGCIRVVFLEVQCFDRTGSLMVDLIQVIDNKAD